MIDRPPFQLHIEPERPIELNDMLRALSAIGRQFEVFAVAEGFSTAKNAKLLISSVRPGSIDIGLLPDLSTFGPLVAPAMVYAPGVLKFASALKGLLDKFKKKETAADASIKDCNDAIAITRPTAESGGTQTFHINNGPVYSPVFVLNAPDAGNILDLATARKIELESYHSDTHQRVAFVWHGLDVGEARTGGKANPDKGVIEEIDLKPRPVFFEDQFAGIKRKMLDDQANPYKQVYFVDASVSRVAGKVVAYRIIGFHGEAEREE